MSVECRVEYKANYLATIVTLSSAKCVTTNAAGTLIEIQQQDGVTRMFPLDVIHCIAIKRTGT